RALESLVKCGALPGSRRGMLTVLEQALAMGQKLQADRMAGQGSIFDLGPAEDAKPRHHPPTPSEEFEKNELLRLEKEPRGLNVPHPPSRRLGTEPRKKPDAPPAELERRGDGEIVTVGGIVSDVKPLTTKKGEPMVFMRLDDVTGGAEIVVFNSTYATAS